MMWLSLIKSSEWLNRNFSTRSQNRIGFKFGFCTCLGVLIITFYSDIRLQWNWWRWKDNKKWNKYVRNRFFLIWKYTMPKSPRNSGRIWNHFPTWIEVSISYLDKKTRETFFFGIPRASSPLLVSINKLISFKGRCACT
jgi:hypothetical protein